MRSGLLRHRIDIETKTTTRGDRGLNTDTWSALHSTVPASVVTLSGRELELARQLVAEATDVVTIRYYSGIDTKARVKFGTRYLQIAHINNVDNRDIELQLTCTETV